MSPASAPAPADGLVVEVNGGHIARPAAESVLTLGLSPANRYSERPLASVSVFPKDVCWTDIADVAATAGAFLALLPAVATIAAIAPATTSATTDIDSRVRFMTSS